MEYPHIHISIHTLRVEQRNINITPDLVVTMVIVSSVLIIRSRATLKALKDYNYPQFIRY